MESKAEQVLGSTKRAEGGCDLHMSGSLHSSEPSCTAALLAGRHLGPCRELKRESPPLARWPRSLMGLNRISCRAKSEETRVGPSSRKLQLGDSGPLLGFLLTQSLWGWILTGSLAKAPGNYTSVNLKFIFRAREMAQHYSQKPGNPSSVPRSQVKAN